VGNLSSDNRGYEHIKWLAAKLGLRVPNLLAMAPKNDPFFCGSPSQRVKAEWFAALWTRFHYTTGHLRRIHYRMVTPHPGEPAPHKQDGTPYENTEGCWDYLNDASKYARYLRLVSPEAIVDRRNPEPHLYMQPELLFRERRVLLEELEEWSLPAIEHELASFINLSLPGIDEITGYDYHATDQPYHLEIWVEKSTQDDVLLPICEALHVNLVTSIGFQSISSVVKLLQRVCELARICKAGKPARVFYVSDFDPSGTEMPSAVARQVEFWIRDYVPGADIKLTPLALTREQVIEYALPRIPIKDSDARKGHFEEVYGEGAVELDALEALYPGELGRIVREAIEPYRDLTLEERLDEAEGEARERAEEAWEDCIALHREELDSIEQDARQIVAGYEHELRQLNDRLQVELAPLHERMASVRLAVQEDMALFQVMLPERPEPETDPVDEDDWLFDSNRTYLAQLAMYKRRKNGQTEDAA
jgi:hypothetical protein